jgi:hypothetical protein
MLSILVAIISFSTADVHFTNVQWSTNSDGTVHLLPIAQPESYSTTIEHSVDFKDRKPAGNNNPEYENPRPYPTPTPAPSPRRPRPDYVPPIVKNAPAGLGKYSCIKKGFAAGGYPTQSDKMIALFAVRSKDIHDGSWSSQTYKDKQSLRETIRTLSIVGPCTDGSYEFTPKEAQNAENWISTKKVSIPNDDFKQTFQIKAQYVSQSIDTHNNSPSRVRRNWNYWAKGTPAHSCAKTLPAKKRVQLCRTIAAACRIEEVGCGRGYVENDNIRDGGDGNSGGNNGSDSGNNTGGNTGGNDTGGNTGGNDTGGNDTGGNTGGNDTGGEVGAGGNAESGHGADNGGGHGEGPGNH